MIHLITAQNKSAYKDVLPRLHRARKEVFVDELGWDLKLADGLEYDEYDDDRAMSVVGFDIHGEVMMSIRFRPTDDHSMLVDHFSHVLHDGQTGINAPDTWEVSRGFCREMGRKRHNLMRKAACMIAPLEVAQARGVTSFIGFSDLRVINFFNNIGWRLEFLGDAVPYGQGDGIAYRVEVSESVIEDIRKRWGLPNPAHIYLLPEALQGADPLEYAAEMAKTLPEMAQLLPRPERTMRPRRLPDEHRNEDRLHHAVSRQRTTTAKPRRDRSIVNQNEGLSA